MSDSVGTANVEPVRSKPEKYVLYLVSLKRNDAKLLDSVVSSVRVHAERIEDYKHMGLTPAGFIALLVSDYLYGVRASRKAKKAREDDILSQRFADDRRRRERLKKSSARTSCNSLS